MDVLLDEVESLEAILMDDVKITKNSETGFPELIETVVLPTVGEEIDSQYVCITLQVMPSIGYPDIKPKYQLRNPRGLDDMSIEQIRAAVEQKLIESLGSPVVFDLIDVIREHLTDSNLPSGQCVVCLYGFQDGDAFTKTDCYHYLHSYCLARHLDASKNNYDEEQEKLPAWQRKSAKPYQAFCPVCREPINDDPEPLRNATPPSELQNAPEFELTSDLKGLQARMANLFMHQKKRGGIIDLNADDSNVISIDSEENNQMQARNNITKHNATIKLASENSSSSVSTVPNNQTNNSRLASKTTADAKHKKKNSTVPDGTNGTSKKQAAERADDDDDDDEEDDNDSRHNHHYGRRGGNRHRRNGYHHHHHQRTHQNAKVGNNNANVEQANKACSSNTR